MQLNNVPAEVAKKLPRYPLVPTTLIGRLAVSIDFRGQGHGETLLTDALHRILQHSGEVASAGVIVDAKDAEAVSFYKKYGFLELPEIERRLFLPMRTVAELFGSSTYNNLEYRLFCTGGLMEYQSQANSSQQCLVCEYISPRTSLAAQNFRNRQPTK